ncbi:MAG: ATP-binding protein [Kiloniellaceae bacterium]
MADRAVVRVLLVGDDSGVIEDFRHLFAVRRPSGSKRSVGKLEAELFGAAVDHDDFPVVDLMVCRQGGEGVQAVRGALAEERPFAVTFIDMQLAPGLDWVQTGEQLRAWDPALQLVMLAGHSDVHPMDICARIPPADKLFFVQKPFHALEVKQLVCALAARWRLGPAGLRLRQSAMVPESATARALLTAVQHQPVGAMVFDRQDYLLAANPELLRLFPELADALVAGMTYEDVQRLMADRLLPESMLIPRETWLRDRLEWHGRGGGAIEQGYSDDRWVLVHERTGGQELTFCHYFDVSHVKRRNISHATEAQMKAIAQAFAGLCERLDLGAANGAGRLPMIESPPAHKNVSAVRARGLADRPNEDLSHKMLAVAQRLKLDPKPLNLNRLVADAMGRAQSELGAAIQVQVVEGAGLWDVLIDGSEFARVLFELMRNAAEAMPEGGRIVVESANVRLSREFAAAHGQLNAGEYVRLTIEDGGCGMSADLAQRALNPFFSAKRQGCHDGLGLSVAYGFASQSGGHLGIESRKEEGACVTLYFPRSAIDSGSLGADVHVVAPKGRTSA